MKGLLFPGDRQVLLSTFADPVPGSGEVLIRMTAAGICGSDLSYLYRTPSSEKDKLRFGVYVSSKVIPGHEPCGVVEAVGDGVEQLKVGDRVVVYHISGCGWCQYCRAGLPMHCSNKKTYGFDIHGGFADFLVARERDCIPVPDELPDKVAAYCACGAATAYKALKRAGASGRDTILVCGLGPVGLALVAFGKMAGSTVIASDPVIERHGLAKELGADWVINPAEVDVVSATVEITRGRGADIAIDASANPVARNQVLDAVGPWGIAVFVGEGNVTTVDPSVQIIHKQLTLLGSWVCSVPEMNECMDFVVNKRVPLEKVITHEFALEQAAEALQTADQGKCGKVVFIWHSR